MIRGKSGTGIFLWGGLSLISGLPFLAAGIAAYFLSGSLYRGIAFTSVLLFAVWYLTGFHGAGVTAVCAVTAAAACRSGFPAMKAILLTAGFTLFAGGIFSLWFPGFMNMNLTDLEPLREVYVSTGMDSGTVDRVFQLIIHFSPGIGAIQLVAGAIASVFLFRSICRKTGRSHALQGQVRFNMHWGTAWIPILCLFTIILARTQPVPDLVERIAGNLLLFMSLPYFIQGLQVVLLWISLVPGMVFLLIISVVFATPLVAAAILLTGILDTWFDYRKKIENRIERINNEGSSDKGR